MKTDRRYLAALALASLAACILLACAAQAMGEADGRRSVAAVPLDRPDDRLTTPADSTPDVATGLTHWWETGALAAPVTGLALVVLIGLERLSTTRWRRLAWLRRGSVRAYLSMTIGAVTVLVPAIATGSVTWGGLSVALLGGLVAFRPGGGEAKPAAEGVPT